MLLPGPPPPVVAALAAPGEQIATPSAICRGQPRCLVGLETFDARSVGGGQNFASDFGTGGRIRGSYSGVDVAAADLWGGAGGEGRYAQTFGSYTLSFSGWKPNYFGIWLSALDGGNALAFYDGSRMLRQFTATDFRMLTGGCNGSPYCANPTARFFGQAAHEPFAFVSFWTPTGGFDRITFHQLGPGGFESDNHMVGVIGKSPAPAPGMAAILGLAALGVAARTGAGRP
ncbi:MAG: hypothetical protein RQ833_11200 [Sphingomonadaceae bacterium]|nr:hypothetical protein [Sphingomonadaceae bacterium]